MKKSLLILVVFTLSLNAYSQVPNYVPSNGLEGWWPFNGNANDESGNGNNGTVNGATLTTDRFGNSTMAYSFDYTHWSWGSGGDWISIPYNVSLAPNNISVSVWANRSSEGYPGQGMTLINRYEQGYSNPNGQTWFIGLPASPNTTINASVLQAAPSNNQAVLTNFGPFLGLNNWTHIVMTFDGISLKQFINGLLTSTVPANGFTLNTAGTSGISIGMSDQANGHWWPLDGNIDDIGIWNRALTECEIQNLYLSQLGAQSTLTQTALDSYTLNGQTYTQSGTYTQVIPSANGCDSTITLNLTLNFTGIHDLGTATKILVKITDLNGKIIQRRKNTVMLFIYEDGSVERVVEME